MIDLDSDLRTVEETEQIEELDVAKIRHIINPPLNIHIWKFGMSAQDVVDIARVRGWEVVALCGARFVPTKNPEEIKDTCDTCLGLAGIMLNNPPEND